MSQTTYTVDTPPPRRKRTRQNTSPTEQLPIRVHNRIVPCLAAGATRLYCYWKISLYIDLAQRDIVLYVPPEWRFLTPELLEEWTGKLRDNPYEDIVLGRTSYNWAVDVLLPSRQFYYTVPIHGRNGWPNFLEPIPYWNRPRINYVTDELPITINRAPLLPSLGMGRVVCYWPMRLPRTVQPRRYVWVPPEWRRLTDKTRRMWARRLGANPDQPITLGGIHYYWKCDTIIPHGQNPTSIEYLGEGRYDETESPGVEIEKPSTSQYSIDPNYQNPQQPDLAFTRMMNSFINQYEDPVPPPNVLENTPGMSNEMSEGGYVPPRRIFETSV